MKGLRLGGHPLHPALVHFPIVCWTAAPVLDGLYLLKHDPSYWHAASLSIGIGVVTGLAAMGAGFLDLLSLSAEDPAQATASRHMLLVCSAWCVFSIGLLFRPLRGVPTLGESWLGLGLSFAGLALLLAGAYAGAQLVYGFGVGQADPCTKDPFA
jgi:uncharacterized membrane protein